MEKKKERVGERGEGPNREKNGEKREWRDREPDKRAKTLGGEDMGVAGRPHWVHNKIHLLCL